MSFEFSRETDMVQLAMWHSNFRTDGDSQQLVTKSSIGPRLAQREGTTRRRFLGQAAVQNLSSKQAREYSYDGESGEGASDEKACEFSCGGNDVDGGGSGGGTAAGASGKCAAQRSGSGAAGHVAGGESREHVCESGCGAIREEHDGGGRSDAGGEVQL